MARTQGSGAGIGIGGILVIAGIVIALFWSVLLGIIVALIGPSRSAASRRASGTDPAAVSAVEVVPADAVSAPR